MGGNWAGEAPNMKNHRHYDDFIYLQSKVLFYLIFYMKYVCQQILQAALSLVVMVRQLPEGAPKDPRIESIPAYLTRIYQDCPLYSFNSRKVIGVFIFNFSIVSVLTIIRNWYKLYDILSVSLFDVSSYHTWIKLLRTNLCRHPWQLVKGSSIP